MRLDPERASRIYGSSRAAWFQEGQYFTHDGEPISFEEAAGPAPADVASGYVKPPPAEAPVVTTVVAPPAFPETPTADVPVEREAGAKTWGDDRYLKLKALKPNLLATMVMKAGGTPETGSGSKRANIQWLLDNVP